MSRLYIKGNNKNTDGMVVMLNNQPLTRLQSLKLELDENKNSVAHLSFYPSAIDISTEVTEGKEEETKPKKTKSKPKK